MASAPALSLAQTLAARAAKTLSHVTKTDYKHDICIDEAAGIFYCDCSGYVEYLLSRVAPRHLAPIQDAATERGAERPLAKDFYAFFDAQPVKVGESDDDGNGEDSPGWIKIPMLAAARRGDILAWRLAHSKDTGHVVLLAETPIPVADAAAPGPCFAVRVYDSSEYVHFDDSREGPDGFVKGVGESTIHVDVNVDGAPAGFRFSGGSNHHVEKSMATARVLRFGGE